MDSSHDLVGSVSALLWDVLVEQKCSLDDIGKDFYGQAPKFEFGHELDTDYEQYMKDVGEEDYQEQRWLRHYLDVECRL